MNWQYTPFIIPLFLATIISGALALYAWQRGRPGSGATAFALLMLVVAQWSLGYALELGGADLNSKIFWGQVEYLGIASLPLAWLAFALHYTNRDKWLTRRNLALLAIVPAITIVLSWTNQSHGLIWNQIGLDASGPFLALDVTYGGWFWVQSLYSYALLLLGTFFLLKVLTRPPQLYRQQTSAILVGTLIPWVGNGLYISGLSPIPNLDLTPFAFTLSGLVIGWGLFRFKLLDIVPIARRAVVDSMSDGVIVLDTQHRVVDLNPAAQHIVNYTASEAIGKTDMQVLSGLGDFVEHYGQATEVRTEVVLDRDNSWQCFEIDMSALYDRQHHLTGRLIVLRDITERKQAEQAIERTLAEIDRAKREWEASVDSLPQLICLLDRQGCIIRTNRAVESWNLALVTEVKTLTLPGLLHGRSSRPTYPLEKFWSETWKELTQGRSIEHEIEDNVLKRHLYLQAQPISPQITKTYEIEATSFAVVVVHDITDRKRAEEVLAHARDQALEASHLKSQLLAKVSHELRTPLGAILGYTELIQNSAFGPVSDKQIEITEKVIDSTQYLTELVNELLDQAQLEVGRLKLSISPFDLRKMVSRVEARMSKLAQTKGLAFTVDIAADMPVTISGDENRLQQILLNLVSNAIKFTKTGKIQIRLFRFDADHWSLEVSDTGAGIPREAQSYIFEPFRQVDGSITKEHRGYGLGLSIVKQLTTAMGGRITLESELGQGSTFTITLPLTPMQDVGHHF